MMATETRKCLACGGEQETKRSTEFALSHAGCGGQLVKSRVYESHKRTNKVY